MAIDATEKVTIDAVMNSRVLVGAFNSGGKQTIDLSDISEVPKPSSMLPTQGAQVIHEIKEVFNAVKDGKPSDFISAHKGSAKTAEDAVNKEESGITRKGEGVPLPEKDSTYKIKEKYDKSGETIDVEWLVKRTENNHQVQKVQVEKPPAPKGGRFVTQEDPGIFIFDEEFNSTGFLPVEKPGYLEIDSFGNLYVSDQANNKVLVYETSMDSAGNLLLNKRTELQHSSLHSPQGIAVSALQERIFVGSGDQIFAFDLAGTFLQTFSDPQLRSVRGLEVDRSGTLFASSFLNDSIIIFDPINGAILSAISSPFLDGPEGIVIDQLGNIWVSSFENDSILKFDSGGFLIESLSVGIELDGPKGLGLTPQGFLVPGLTPGRFGNLPETLLVSSFNNDMVLEYDLDNGSLVNSVNVKTPVGVGQLTREPSQVPGPLPVLGLIIAYQQTRRLRRLSGLLRINLGNTTYSGDSRHLISVCASFDR